MRLTERDFVGDSRDIAQRLIGMNLGRLVNTITYRGRIRETGAYHGYIERGKRKGLAYAPGRIYMHSAPRGYWLLAIATGSEGEPSVVTIRELYPLEGVDRAVHSAGLLTRSLNIGKEFDGLSIAGNELWIEGTPIDSKDVVFISPNGSKKPMSANCLGYYRGLY